MAFKMVSEFAPITFPPAKRLHSVVDRAAEARVAASAFAALIFRYTGSEAITISLWGHATTAQATLRISLADDTAIDELTAPVTAQLPAWLADDLTLAWTADGASLTIDVRLPDLRAFPEAILAKIGYANRRVMSCANES